MEKKVLQQKLEEHFKWFHRHPEVSNDEFKTTERIKTILNEAGIEVMDAKLKTGLAAKITGKKPEPLIALRCDIDALPIIEASGLDYASENHGVMHACGHDFHIASVLGAGLLLKEEVSNLEGSVILLFQPAEEGGGGAKQVVESGVLKGVSEIYGMHNSAAMETGVIGISPGATHAFIGFFKIKITGKGSHAAHPQRSQDPIIATAQLINAAQTIVSRNISPFDQAVVSITHVEAGSTWNVIPQTATLEGTFRTFSDENMELLGARMQEICRGVGISSRVEIEFTWGRDCYPVINDAALSEWLTNLAKKLGYETKLSSPTMGGEDFSEYQKTIPGVFWNMGAKSVEGLHHPAYAADISSLSTASVFFADQAKAALRRLSGLGE